MIASDQAASSGLTPTVKHSDSAPLLYFDLAPTFGVTSGAIQVELAARKLVPLSDGSISSEFVFSGHLRCSPAAAQHLRNALDEVLKMVAQPQGPPIAAGKLN